MDAVVPLPSRAPLRPPRQTATDHAALVLLAERWLRRRNCGIVLRDPFAPPLDNGEKPDAIGWRDGLSILVECKATRSDFFSDRRKKFRESPEAGMGDWRFYLCPKGLLTVSDLPAGWGLLEAAGDRVRAVCGVPANTEWHQKKPFAANKFCETQMLGAALRRVELRGGMECVYDPNMPVAGRMVGQGR